MRRSVCGKRVVEPHLARCRVHVDRVHRPTWPIEEAKAISVDVLKLFCGVYILSLNNGVAQRALQHKVHPLWVRDCELAGSGGVVEDEGVVGLAGGLCQPSHDTLGREEQGETLHHIGRAGLIDECRYQLGQRVRRGA
ncbi:hypothetical protein HYQ46_005626 [Verticillium longisporum]|nr:hypothetical protein HYQ46_005626 [Verticillium longisporum]